jgi:hypothetical protein
MKKLMTMISLIALSTMFIAETSFAHPGHGMGKGRKGKMKKSRTVVRGKRAKAIYEALVDADVVTKNRPKVTADIKKVASLRCAKLTSKADTSKVRYRCALRGKKGKRFGRRGHRRGQRFHQN